MALLTMKGPYPQVFFDGGRALERVWLTATELGLAIQPIAALGYLFARLERGNGDGFTNEEQHTLRGLRAEYKSIFTLESDEAELLLFRIAVAEPPTARSLRRPVESVLSFEEPIGEGTETSTVRPNTGTVKKLARGATALTSVNTAKGKKGADKGKSKRTRG